MKRINLLAVLGILVVLPVIVSAQAYNYPGMGGMMYGYYGSGTMIFGWLVSILIVIALVVFIFWMIKQIQKK